MSYMSNCDILTHNIVDCLRGEDASTRRYVLDHVKTLSDDQFNPKPVWMASEHSGVFSDDEIRRLTGDVG